MSDDILDYYSETISDVGKRPLILEVELANLDQSLLEPDQNGIDEPIATVLNISEAEIQAAWALSDQSWWDSIKIIKSARYTAPIAPEFIRVIDEDGESHSLADYMIFNSQNASYDATRLT